MVGFPQPRLTDSLRPIAWRTSAEYEPEQPQSGPSAWQQPGFGSVEASWMTVICFATPEYLDRTASRTWLMAEGSFNRWLSMGGILTQPIDDCLWLVVQSRG